MKRFIHLAVALAAAAAVSTAEAKKPEKEQEDEAWRHVTVTLVSGEQVDGYIQRGWHAESSLLKRENYSFTIVAAPDSDEKTRYTADDVSSVEYVEVDGESYPDGIRWESLDIASPSIGNRYHTLRRMVCLMKADDNATLYWWKQWDWREYGKVRRRELVTYYGIRFNDDEERILYPYIFLSTVLLKDKKPGLQEFDKAWFKGAEGKEHKKQSKDDPTWVLDMYRAYLEESAQ